MAVTRDSTKVIRGYADIYYGPVGTALPADTVALGGTWPVGWTGVGFTDEGLEIEKSVDTDDITVEEQLTPVDVAVTGVGVAVRFTLAEDSVANMKVAYGGASIATQAAASGVIGKSTLTFNDTLDQYALAFEAKNALGLFRRVLIPKVISIGSVATSYRRADKRVYPVEFRAICDPKTIQIVEQTAIALP